MTYKGPERRELMNVRKIIEDAMPKQRFLLVAMTRKLGPDRLRDTDAELGKNYNCDEVYHAINRRITNPWNTRGKPIILDSFIYTPPGKLPESILTARFEGFDFLQKETKQSLDAAGIKTVGDFVMLSGKELIETKGLGKEAMDDASLFLLNRWGVRSVCRG